MKIVNVNDRIIDADALNGQIVAFDNTSYTIRFRVSKLYNGETDLSTYTWYLIFRNSEDQGDVVALTTAVNDDNSFFVDWHPGGLFTQVGGGCNFQLFAISGDNKWHTDTCYIIVKKSLTSSSDSPLEPSVLLTYLSTFQELKSNASESATAAEDAATAAINAKNAAIAAKDLAVSSKDTAVSASGTAVAAKDIAVQSKNNAQTAKEAAEAAERAAKGYRDEAMALAGVGNHVQEPMPHQFQVGNTWVKYGFRLTATGKPQFIYEEVS